eukprot:scaffold103025_cov57-Phaeocystis_antarctica.AAC.2
MGAEARGRMRARRGGRTVAAAVARHQRAGVGGVEEAMLLEEGQRVAPQLRGVVGEEAAAALLVLARGAQGAVVVVVARRLAQVRAVPLGQGQ